MIVECGVLLEDDTVLGSLWLRDIPRTSELLWFTSNQDSLRDQHQTTCFRVKLVAHWVSTVWHPNTHNGNPIHSVCLYVEPVL